jgi:GTPase
MLRENRVVASDIPGTTRDAVHVQWQWQGRRVVLVDTAGIKPGTMAKDRVELAVNEMVDDTIGYSHVVAIIIDCMEAFTAVDMAIIKRTLDEGRAIVIVGNKWDLIEDKYKRKATKWMDKQLEKGLGQAKAIPITYVSAKTGLRVDSTMDEVLRVYEKWNTRVSTGLLNKWLYEFNKVQRMPNEKGSKLKLKYIMQIKIRPPTFFVFCNRKNLCS